MSLEDTLFTHPTNSIDISFNGNGHKLYHNYQGINLSILGFKEEIQRQFGYGKIVDVIIESHPNRCDMYSLGVLCVGAFCRIIEQSQYKRPTRNTTKADIYCEVINNFRGCYRDIMADRMSIFRNKAISRKTDDEYFNQNIFQNARNNIDNDNDNDTDNDNIEDTERSNFVNSLRKQQLVKILKGNGRDSKGRIANLRERILKDASINIHIEVPSPRRARTRTTTQQTQQQHQEDNNNNNDNDNDNDNDDEEEIINTNKEIKRKEKLRKALCANIAKTRRKLKIYKKKISEIQNNWNDLDDEQIQSRFDELTDLLEELEELQEAIDIGYAAVPRAGRAQYQGTDEYISNYKSRLQQFNNESKRILKRLHCAWKQTGSFFMFGYGNIDTLGRFESSVPEIWFSGSLLRVDFEGCTNIADTFEKIIGKFEENRAEYRQTPNETALTSIIIELFKNTLESGSEQHIKIARKIVKKIGINVDSISNDDDNDNDDDTEMDE